MTSQYTILVRNLSTSTQTFYVFQQQASFLDPDTITTPLSNSLGSRSLAAYSSSGAQLTFSFDTRIYAGAISTMSSAPTTAATAATVALFATTQSQASQPISVTLSPTNSATKNQTQLGLYPLTLSAPTNVSSANIGYFGIQVPAFTPSVVPQLYCGNASLDSSGIVTLSSYLAPSPNTVLYCNPQPVYYVRTGNYPTGTAISYDTTNAATCAFSGGVSTILVTYNPDGTFSTQATL